MRFTHLFAWALTLLLPALGAAPAVAQEQERLQVALEPEGAIPIGEFHSWIAHVRRGDRSVERARIEIGGGMEGHGHGLPTTPRVTRQLGDGRYRIEGVKFTMAGAWTLVLKIDVDGRLETHVFPIEVGTLTAARSNGSGWTPEEIELLRSLSLYDVDGPPDSPSNRFADDARAARFGRRLFFDKRLSGNGEVSCADCHQPSRYFTDGKPRSEGTGTTQRNAPTVVGSSHLSWFYWDGRRDSLWAQALIPLEAPAEMGSNREAVIELIREDPEYRRLYAEIFGEAPRTGDGLDRAFANVGKAIAAYERTLEPPTTRFDRYVATLIDRGAESAAELLSEDELAGARLFLDDERTRCMRCHNGPMLSNQSFHNIGTGNFSGETPDLGRVFGLRAVRIDPYNCLGEFSDAEPEQCKELRFLNDAPDVPLEGAFKVPTLRGLTRTAPYMHDGSRRTLDAVIDHYLNPPDNPETHELLPASLTETQKLQLIAFLESLSPGR